MRIKPRGQVKAGALEGSSTTVSSLSGQELRAMIDLGLVSPGEVDNDSLGIHTPPLSRGNTTLGRLDDQKSSPEKSLGTPRPSSVTPPPQREPGDESGGATHEPLFRSEPMPRVLKGRQWEPLCGKYPNYFLEGTENSPPYELTQYSREVFSSDEAFEEYEKKRLASIQLRAEWYRQNRAGKG